MLLNAKTQVNLIHLLLPVQLQSCEFNKTVNEWSKLGVSKVFSLVYWSMLEINSTGIFLFFVSCSEVFSLQNMTGFYMKPNAGWNGLIQSKWVIKKYLLPWDTRNKRMVKKSLQLPHITKSSLTHPLHFAYSLIYTHRCVTHLVTAMLSLSTWNK